MTGLERRVAHLLGWHAPECTTDHACTESGAADINSLGWHRHLAARAHRRTPLGPVAVLGAVGAWARWVLDAGLGGRP